MTSMRAPRVVERPGSRRVARDSCSRRQPLSLRSDCVGRTPDDSVARIQTWSASRRVPYHVHHIDWIEHVLLYAIPAAWLYPIQGRCERQTIRWTVEDTRSRPRVRSPMVTPLGPDVGTPDIYRIDGGRPLPCLGRCWCRVSAVVESVKSVSVCPLLLTADDQDSTPRSSERPASSRDHWGMGRPPGHADTGGQSGDPPLVRVMEHCWGQPGGESSHDSWRPYTVRSMSA